MHPQAPVPRTVEKHRLFARSLCCYRREVAALDASSRAYFLAPQCDRRALFDAHLMSVLEHYRTVESITARGGLLHCTVCPPTGASNEVNEPAQLGGSAGSGQSAGTPRSLQHLSALEVDRATDTALGAMSLLRPGYFRGDPDDFAPLDWVVLAVATAYRRGQSAGTL